MPRLVTLETWAEAEFGKDAPSLRVLRQWAGDGRLQPLPQLIGRRYFLPPSARYVPPFKASGTKVSGMRLAERIAVADRGPLVTGRRRT